MNSISKGPRPIDPSVYYKLSSLLRTIREDKNTSLMEYVLITDKDGNINP